MRYSLQKILLLLLVIPVLYVVIGYSVEIYRVQQVNNAISTLRMLGKAIQDFNKSSGNYPCSVTLDELCKEISFDSKQFHSFSFPDFCEIIYLRPSDCSIDCMLVKCTTKIRRRLFSLKRYYIEITLFSDTTVSTKVVYIDQ